MLYVLRFFGKVRYEKLTFNNFKVIIGSGGQGLDLETT